MPKRKANIMGSSFYPGAGRRVMSMAQGAPLLLKREPENQFDTNAVAVYSHGLKLGHLSRQLAAHFAPLMDNGLSVSCRKFSMGNALIALEWDGPDVPEVAK